MSKKLKPIRLFGVDQANKNCFFIHEEGEGFWFISHKEKTVGESVFLKNITTAIDELEISSNWLILEICNANHDELLEQIHEKNFIVENREIKSLNKEETKRLIEIYVRTLINDLDFVNPVLWKYKSRLEENISKNRTLFFDYQMGVVETLFKCRYVNDPSVVIPDDTDTEKGYIPRQVLENNKNIIGIEGEFDYQDLSETLALKIYQYANKDFAGLDYLTTAMIKKQEEETKEAKVAPTAVEIEAAEKKILEPIPTPV